MPTPRHVLCCAFPMWELVDEGGSVWVCGTCGSVWDEYGGLVEEGNDGFQIVGDEE